MSKSVIEEAPRFLVCCDWGRTPDRRAIYVADTQERTIRMGGPTPSRNSRAEAWTFAAALELARALRRQGPTLIAFDAPLGLPSSYLDAARTVPRWSAVRSFVDWLPLACAESPFSQNVRVPEAWSVESPFMHVPSGSGSLKRFRDRAARNGVTFKRHIEELTRGNPVFVAAGIPGSVGAAAKDLWQGLGAELQRADRDFGLWPFEGSLSALLGAQGLALGEIFPRAAYAIALIDAPPEARPRLSVAKTQARDRHAAVDRLMSAGWTRALHFDPQGLDHARGNEDAFDAMFTAAALLRCVIERTPLSAPALEDAVSEGGILGAGSVNLTLPEQLFRARAPKLPALPRLQRRPIVHTFSTGARTNPKRIPQGQMCPIPGCGHRFMIGRGGWDAHVSTLKRHLDWAPELREGASRMQRFREEFPEFFR